MMRLKRAAVAAMIGLMFVAVPMHGNAAAVDDPLAGHPEGSYVLPDGGIAIPLRKDPPAWLTEDVRAKTSFAATMGLGYDVGTDRFVHPMALQYVFIRPGAWMLFPSWCTMNFIFGNPGNYAIGSAGHCTSGGDEVIVAAAPSLIFAIGKTKSSRDGGIGNDFSLTSIYSQFQDFVDPDVAVIGGPGCDGYSGRIDLLSPQPVKHFGHGLVVGTGGTPRAGVSFYADNREVYWDSPSAPGDSGSPVLVAATPDCPLGAPLAVLTHLVIIGKNLQFMAGTRIDGATVGNGLPI